MNNELTVNDYIDNIEVDKTKIINYLKSYDSTIPLNEKSTFPEVIEVLQQLKTIKESGTYLWDYFNKDIIKDTNPSIKYYIAGALLIKKYPSFDISNFDGYRSSSNNDSLDYLFAYTQLQEGPELINNKVKCLYCLYYNCKELLLTQSINMPNVTNCDSVFNMDYKLQTVKRITTGKVKNANNMFARCISAQFIDIGGMDFEENATVSNMFYNVPTNCQIIVKNEDVYNLLSSNDTKHTFTIKDLESIQLNANSVINKYYDNSIQTSIYYEGGTSDKKGVTYSIIGNATIDDNGLITLTEDAQAGDIITVTITSTYNPEITYTKDILVLNQEKSFSINLNDGQFVETEELVNGNKVYQSDAGSYNINNGQSIANIKILTYSKFVVYIKSNAESNYDYTELFDLNTEPVRSKGILSTKNKQNQWLRKEYTISNSSEEQTINIMYSKDSSGNNGTDRGYFYISESECE